MTKLRIDLFLKRTGLCKRRSVARKLCDTDRVILNGSPARASNRVKTGDFIEISGSAGVKSVEVLSVPAVVLAKADRHTAFVERGMPKPEQH